ncbi:hypothetical protein, partial [Phenylobacterium aquaticum]
MSKPQAAPAAQPSLGARSLAQLEAAASTARVLNLVAVARDWGRAPGYRDQPLFRSRVLNTALYVKQRLPAGPSEGPGVTTRIFLPRATDALGLGGASLRVGDDAWRERLTEICGGDSPDLQEDFRVLGAVNELPSFDAFLLREHLRRREIEAAGCYVPISASELQGVQGFVINEVAQLVLLAFGKGQDPTQTAKLVGAILSAQNDPRLEPLRRTFGLDEEAFREGVFAWKAFLYYKRAMAELRTTVQIASAEIGRMVLLQPCPPVIGKYVEAGQDRICRALAKETSEAAQILAVYDTAFRDLTEKGDPRGFRDFLTAAPSLFFGLGDRMG